MVNKLERILLSGALFVATTIGSVDLYGYTPNQAKTIPAYFNSEDKTPLKDVAGFMNNATHHIGTACVFAKNVAELDAKELNNQAVKNISIQFTNGPGDYTFEFREGRLLRVESYPAGDKRQFCSQVAVPRGKDDKGEPYLKILKQGPDGRYKPFNY